MTLAAAARAGRRHRRGLALAGRTDRRLGAVVVDHHEPAAWCLPGIRRPVVLTTAAVEALDGPQLAVVLAHERAHQRGRHHLLVALAAALAAAFPRVPAFRVAREQVARLAELAADAADAAAASPRLAVAGALLAMGAPPAGAAALGGGRVLQGLPRAPAHCRAGSARPGRRDGRRARRSRARRFPAACRGGTRRSCPGGEPLSRSGQDGAIRPLGALRTLAMR